MKYTILGESGFIGSHLVAHLQQLGYECFAPKRNDPAIFEKDLGHIIYCVGLTSDFRQRAFDTVQAHVCYLLKILGNTKFESFLYLSSTRLYKNMDHGEENTILRVNPLDSDDLYNISKIMGESICFSTNQANIRVVRLSNVYGTDFMSFNFLVSIIRDALIKGRIIMRTTMISEKDYVSIDDVVNLLPKIAMSGKHQIYNIASGVNVSNQELLKILQHNTGCSIEIAENSEEVIFPKISIDRIQDEFGYVPILINDSLSNLIYEFKQRMKNNDKN